MQENNNAFRWPVRVYYEDTDSGGVVYHSNYLKFLERARTEWLRGKGLEQDRLKQQQGLIFAVRSASIEFIQPARFNEQLEVVTEISEKSRISITFNQTILKQTVDMSQANDAQDVSANSTILCTGLIKVVSLDANTMKPKRMAASLLEEIVSVR